jgi:phosphatidylinositol alpha-1,6-mannosyltransferase
LSRIFILAFESAPFPGGQGTVSWELASELAMGGEEVVLVAPQYDGAEALDATVNFEVRRVLEHQRLNLRAISNVARALADISPMDTLVACDIRSGICSTLVRVRKSFRKVLYFHGGEVRRASSSWLGKLSNHLSAAYSDLRIANSRYSAGLVETNLGLSCEAINPGVATYWLEEDVDPNSVSAIERLVGQPSVIVATVARITERKGQLEGIAILSEVARQTGICITYVIVGKVIDPAYFEALNSASSNSSIRVIISEPLSRGEIKRLYQASSLTLLPARADTQYIEGFGLVLVEAAAQGCPSVAYDVGGIRDAIADGVSGYVVPQGDRSRMVSCVRSIVEGGDKMIGSRILAKQFASAFKWSDTANRITKI